MNRRARVNRKRHEAKKEYIVFISHSAKDAWMARVVAEKITEIGAIPWLDAKEVKGGDLIADKIRQGVEACREAVVLVSPYR